MCLGQGQAKQSNKGFLQQKEASDLPPLLSLPLSCVSESSLLTLWSAVVVEVVAGAVAGAVAKGLCWGAVLVAVVVAWGCGGGCGWGCSGAL